MKRYLALIVLTGIIASCGKSYNPYPGPYSSLQAALDSEAVSSNVTTMDAAMGGTITSKNGTVYIIQPNSFITSTGSPVTGFVDITTKEFLAKPDMMFSRVLPVSDGDPLVSAGEFYMVAKQNGQELSMGSPYTVKMPRHDTLTGMQLYTSIHDSGINGRANWQLQANTAGNFTYSRDTITLTTIYTNYNNADRGLTGKNGPPGTGGPTKAIIDISSNSYKTFTISLTSTDGLGDDKDIMAYVSYDGYNAIWPLNTIKFGAISENHVPGVPVHFAVFAVHHGYTYAGFLAATPVDNANYKIDLVKTTPSSFRAQVNALP